MDKKLLPSGNVSLVSGANSVFSIHLRKVNNRRVFKWRKTFLGSGSAGGYEVVVLCNSIHSTRCLRLRCGCGLIHYFSFSFFFYYFVTGTFLSSTMGKVKTFVCFVLYFAHQRWHSHYRGGKKPDAMQAQNILFWHQDCEPRRRRWATNRALLNKGAKYKR